MLLLPSLFSLQLFSLSLLHGISLNEDHKRSSCLEMKICSRGQRNRDYTVRFHRFKTLGNIILASYPLKFVVLPFPPFFVSVSSLYSASPSIFVHHDFVRERVLLVLALAMYRNQKRVAYDTFKRGSGHRFIFSQTASVSVS